MTPSWLIKRLMVKTDQTSDASLNLSLVQPRCYYIILYIILYFMPLKGSNSGGMTRNEGEKDATQAKDLVTEITVKS